MQWATFARLKWPAKVLQTVRIIKNDCSTQSKWLLHLCLWREENHLQYWCLSVSSAWTTFSGCLVWTFGKERKRSCSQPTMCHCWLFFTANLLVKCNFSNFYFLSERNTHNTLFLKSFCSKIANKIIYSWSPPLSCIVYKPGRVGTHRYMG